jgi:hypothetical protein
MLYVDALRPNHCIILGELGEPGGEDKARVWWESSGISVENSKGMEVQIS